ncbi:retrovirus-related pol polyprotein from transposon TNT 1-94 [Tanacetum coccineum]
MLHTRTGRSFDGEGESHSLSITPTQGSNYTTYDLELGAVLFALKMWRHYVYDTKCVMFTDHKSLQHILDQKELNIRQRRWLEFLSDYDCEIRYHPGKANVQIPNAQAEARKEGNFVTEDYMQALDAHEDEGILPKTIRFTNTTRNTPLEMGKNSHGLYHKPAKDNKLLLHDLGNRDHQKNYVNVGRKPLEFHVGDEIQIDDKLQFTDEPIKIMDCEVKHLKQSRIPIVKGFMERGFLDNSDKKKKEGGSKVNEGPILILGDLARRVKDIEGKPTMPKGILKKAIRNVSDDTHEVVIPLNDVGSVTKDNQEATKDLNGANQVGGADGAKSSSFVDAQRNMGPEHVVHFRTLFNEEKVDSFDCVLPKAATNMVKSRNDDGVYLFKFASKTGMEQVLEKGTVDDPINFARALIEICSHSTLKKEVTMAIPEDEGDGHNKEVIRVEYEWKPPHCVDCKSFGHGPNLCPKRVREDIPKAPSMAAKSSIMEENEEGFVEVKSQKKNKGAAPRSFGGLRLPKPNSKVTWQQKKSVGSKGGSNAASSSGSTNENEKGDSVLNVGGEDVCDSNVQEPKVSEHIGTSSSNLDNEEVQEEGLWSRFKKAKENAKSKKMKYTCRMVEEAWMGFRVFVDLVMDQKRVEGDELLRGVANRMNKLSGKGEVATKHQRVAARVLNPRSSIDQHGRNNDGVQPRVFENPIAYGGPRVSESSKQNGSNDSEGNMQS